MNGLKLEDLSDKSPNSHPFFKSSKIALSFLEVLQNIRYCLANIMPSDIIATGMIKKEVFLCLLLGLTHEIWSFLKAGFP